MPQSAPTSEHGDLVLDVQNLHVRFAHESGSLHAVRGFSFGLHAGESLAIVGESGSGKSATAMAVMGLHPESARVDGSICLHGEQLLNRDDKSMSRLRGKSIAMVFQDPLSAMTPVYTIGEQIAESILVHDSCSSESALRRAVELLDLVGIAEPHRRVHAYPHEFSGGMRQRVMIAMAIANNPDVIIADEPTTALDVTIQAQVLDVLQRACNEMHAGLILITHDLGVVARVADRAIVMYAGKAVEQAEIITMFNSPAMPYTMGLLGALPNVANTSTTVLSTIPGYPPSPLSPASGCSFAPRCPLVSEHCRTKEPELLPTMQPDQYSACFRQELITDKALKHSDLFLPESDVSGVSGVSGVSSVSDVLELSGVPGESSEQPDVDVSVEPSSTLRTVLLELSNVKQHYPLYKGSVFRRQIGTVFAVDGIDLQLREGETLALVGESGCGKSTTALSILDLVPPTQGSIRLFDNDVHTLRDRRTRLTVRRRLQVVFQDPMSSLDPRMPVFDLIAEPLEVFNVPPNAVNERVRECLALVGLQDTHAQRYPQQLSGGQCQRVCIARALALEPRLLILDEPVSALDVSIRAGIINLLQRLKSTLQLSYLFIAHDLALVRHFADRVAVMYLGRIIETGNVDDVYENPMHPYTRCLLSVIPIPDPQQERGKIRIVPIGDLPDPSDPPAGCRFHTRCPAKLALTDTQQKRCISESPELMAHDAVSDTSSQSRVGAHLYACHFGVETKPDLSEI